MPFLLYDVVLRASCDTVYLEVRGVRGDYAYISLSFDCFSIRIRVPEILVTLFFNLVFGYVCLEFSVAAAISLSFDCFSIMTRLLRIHILTFCHP